MREALKNQGIRYLIVLECTFKKLQKDKEVGSSIAEQIENTIGLRITDCYE